MASKTAIRPTTSKTGEWSSVFPNEQMTEQKSALFIKKLLAVAVSNITYLRAMFPERAYGDRCIEDLNLKILKDEVGCPGAEQVIKWVKGCFDAIEKKYLRMITIAIYTDEEHPNTIIESYTFKISYKASGGLEIYRNDKKISSAYSTEETKKDTIRLLRTIIILTQTLASLPDDVMMTMKLLYYDDVTPPNYEPPGFQPSSNDSFAFEEEPSDIDVGNVKTPFHALKIRIKTIQNNEMEEDVGAGDAVHTNQNIDCKHINDELDNDENIRDDKNGDQKDKLSVNSTQKGRQTLTSDKTSTSQLSEVPPQNELYIINCPCGSKDDENLMILCGVCKTWQHAVCFKILKAEEAPTFHVCYECSQKSEFCDKATDVDLQEMSEISAQATCLWRRALAVSLEFDLLIAPDFAARLGIDVTSAQGLISRLTKEKFIYADPKIKILSKIVNKEKIKSEALSKYFSSSLSESRAEMEDSDLTVNKLSEKTKAMVVNNNAKRRESKRTKRSTIKVTEGDTTQSQKQSRKRTLAKFAQKNELDMADSQDVDCEGDHKVKKKSSIVNRSVMV